MDIIKSAKIFLIKLLSVNRVLPISKGYFGLVLVSSKEVVLGKISNRAILDRDV